MSLYIKTIVCFILMTTPAYAYIDPSSGAMILQGIIAVAAGIGLAFATLRHKISETYHKFFPVKHQGGPKGDSPEGEKD